jgi:hypothetical protein
MRAKDRAGNPVKFQDENKKQEQKKQQARTYHEEETLQKIKASYLVFPKFSSMFILQCTIENEDFN